MPDNGITRVKVLVASPGDVDKERKIAEEVIEDWNIRNSADRKLVLEAVLWEKHAAPENRGDGEGPQPPITRQIVDECKCAIGIFWNRIGTPTKAAPGGAVEEVERMLDQNKPVMLYFSDLAYRRKEIDLEQIAKLDAFRASLTADSLLWEYGDLNEFREKLARHLEHNIPEWFPLSDKTMNNSTDAPAHKGIPRVFIAYSWDDENHKRWVADLATSLRQDGVETRLDQWHAVPGDLLPEFMEREIRENDYVLVICTPRYRLKCDGRDGAAGYEGDIMTAEVYLQKNHKKFIPVLAKGSWNEAAPSWIKGKIYLDLSSPELHQRDYPRLLATLLNSHPPPPPLKPRVVDSADAPALVTPTVVTVDSKSPSFHNKHEEDAEYIRIAGGSYIYSVTGKEVQAEEFYMAKYPVTNRLYRRFIAYLQAHSKDQGFPVSAPSIREELRALAKRQSWWPTLGDYLHEGKNDLAVLFRSTLDAKPKFNGDDQPVVGITWYAARAYCLWLSLLESSGRDSTLYRLPTEVEWEWAAGGQRGAKVQRVRRWPWPEDEGELSIRLANYNSTVGATTPVGSYPDGATPEGLYDMAGNVWEWMEEWYDEKGAARSLRGGSWFDASEYLRCSFRVSGVPGLRCGDVGFRVVRSSLFSS